MVAHLGYGFLRTCSSGCLSTDCIESLLTFDIFAAEPSRAIGTYFFTYFNKDVCSILSQNTTLWKSWEGCATTVLLMTSP